MTTMRGEAHVELPPDVEFPYFRVTYYEQPHSVGITIKATDGRSNRWPDCSQTFHSDGSINSWQHSDDDVQYVWRQKLGELLTDWFLVSDMHLREHLQPMGGRRRFLIDFPSDYKLFTQTKDGRTDHYLVGSKYVGTFRSPQEFFLHARWLIMGADMDPEGFPDCECKYCSKRSQRDIDREFQLPGRPGSGQSGHHSGRPGGSSSAATSGAIINQAKDYRNLKKSTTGPQQTTSKGVEIIDPALLP